VANFYCTKCHNLNHPNIKINCLRLFQNNNKIFLIIKNWDTWQHLTCSHCSPKSCILVTSDNTYMTSQRMKAYFFYINSSKICCHLRLMSMLLKNNRIRGEIAQSEAHRTHKYVNNAWSEISNSPPTLLFIPFHVPQH
jgi:uncharacterized secreted protein with C-terminal beta-propeller domain